MHLYKKHYSNKQLKVINNLNVLLVQKRRIRVRSVTVHALGVFVRGEAANGPGLPGLNPHFLRKRYGRGKGGKKVFGKFFLGGGTKTRTGPKQ